MTTWLAIYDPANPAQPITTAPATDISEETRDSLSARGLAWSEFDGDDVADLRWDPDALAMVAVAPPPPAPDDAQLGALAQQLRDLTTLRQVATQAGTTTTPGLDARIAAVEADLALLAGAYETGQ